MAAAHSAAPALQKSRCHGELSWPPLGILAWPQPRPLELILKTCSPPESHIRLIHCSVRIIAAFLPAPMTHGGGGGQSGQWLPRRGDFAGGKWAEALLEPPPLEGWCTTLSAPIRSGTVSGAPWLPPTPGALPGGGSRGGVAPRPPFLPLCWQPPPPPPHLASPHSCCRQCRLGSLSAVLRRGRGRAWPAMDVHTRVCPPLTRRDVAVETPAAPPQQQPDVIPACRPQPCSPCKQGSSGAGAWQVPASSSQGWSVSQVDSASPEEALRLVAAWDALYCHLPTELIGQSCQGRARGADQRPPFQTSAERRSAPALNFETERKAQAPCPAT